MTQSNHQDYYVTRAAKSRELARRATNPAIAAIHAELATRYDALAAQPDHANAGGTRTVQAA